MKRFFAWKSIAALALAIFCLRAQSAENPADYPRQIPLRTEDKATWYRLDVPMSLYWSAANADLDDLRVFNAEGEALPYALTEGARRKTETRRAARARLFPLYTRAAVSEDPGLRVRRDKNGVLVELLPGKAPEKTRVAQGWLLDVGALDFPLERLRLDWSGDAEGFQRFSIDASDDLEHWRDWGDGQIVRMSFAGEYIDQREIRLPGQTARYLRLIWSAPEAVTLVEAQVSGPLAGHEPALIWSEPVAGQRVDEGAFVWRLPLALPLERARIALPQQNTLAPVLLSGRIARAEDDKPSGNGELIVTRGKRSSSPQWRPLARGVLYRLLEDEREIAQEELELSGEAVNQLRLQVDHRGGGLGREIPELRVALRERQLIFLARGNAPYRLALGRANAPAAALPLDTLIPGYDARKPPAFGRATLAAADLPSTVAQKEEATPWKKTSLWAVLLIGVALLVGMALSLLRASNKSGADAH
jgi:hypothetical protein